MPIKKAQLEVPNVEVEETTPITEAEASDVASTESRKNETLYATVINCNYLRVRKDPIVEDNVLFEIPAGTKIELLDDTDSEFYKVSVKNTIGYCMKKFIERM